MAAKAALRTAIWYRFATRLPQQRFGHTAAGYVVDIMQMRLMSCYRKNGLSKRPGVSELRYSYGCCRLYSEAADKTTVQKLDVLESVTAPYVSKYSTEGFNVRGNRVIGSIALLPTALLHWTVSRCRASLHPLGRPRGSGCSVHVAVLCPWVGPAACCVWRTVYKLLTVVW